MNDGWRSVPRVQGNAARLRLRLLQVGHSAGEEDRWLGHSTTQMVHEHYVHLLNYEERARFSLMSPPPTKR